MALPAPPTPTKTTFCFLKGIFNSSNEAINPLPSVLYPVIFFVLESIFIVLTEEVKKASN